MTDAIGTGRHRGFALLLVLWALVLISLLVTQLASTGRREARIAGNLTRGAKAETAADGAVYEAIFHILDSAPTQWMLDGKDHRLAVDGGTTTVRIESEAGKVNPNTAPPELLQALLVGIGLDQREAAELAAAIVNWRETNNGEQTDTQALAAYAAAGLDHGPPGEPFQSLDELGRVLGMTPEILARLKPHLTLYRPGFPDPAFADPVVRKAFTSLQLDENDDIPHGSGLDAVTITADARLDSGERFIRRAIVRLGAGFDRGFVIGEWRRVDAAD
ncbi:MAG TPA: type II secretion system protein GspK [Stellaceae bacterium]|nr:type II secretion system protein GspK [Stellaceae bacterium]